MKILQVVPYFFPAWAYGGPAKLVYDNSIYLSKQGHQVTVYTSDAFDELLRMPESKKIANQTNFKINYFRNIFNNLTYRYNIFFTPALFLRSLWEVPRFDLIHLHDFYTPHNLWLGLLAYLFYKPYVISVHGCLETERIAQRSLFKKIFLALGGKALLQNADLVIATSENEFSTYLEYGVDQKNISMLKHGVDEKEFQSSLSKIQARKKWHLPSDHIVLTFVGRIHKIKGLNLLVEAFSLLNTKKITLVIAGSDDGYLSQLTTQIKKMKLKNVHLIGTCFGKDKADLFAASDVFVYPSYSEGFSLGILEAGAAGLPLVITTGCHFPEVKSTGSGLIAQPKVRDIANSLKKMIDDPELRKSASKKAKKLIIQQYSLSAIGNSLLKTYAEIIERKYTL